LLSSYDYCVVLYNRKWDNGLPRSLQATPDELFPYIKSFNVKGRHLDIYLEKGKHWRQWSLSIDHVNRNYCLEDKPLGYYRETIKRPEIFNTKRGHLAKADLTTLFKKIRGLLPSWVCVDYDMPRRKGRQACQGCRGLRDQGDIVHRLPLSFGRYHVYGRFYGGKGRWEIASRVRYAEKKE
jgi:hypothetical protein